MKLGSETPIWFYDVRADDRGRDHRGPDCALLPAIQAARESARRAQCASNLMQLGTAMSYYASTHSCLPPGVVNDSGPIKNLPGGYHHSWVVQILPFIGESNTYNHFDHMKSVYDAANDTVAGVKIEYFLLPVG